MTKRLAVMLALVFGLALCAQQAMAYDFDAEMVTGNGEDDAQPGSPYSVYTTDETPWLKLSTDSSFEHMFSTVWKWKNPDTLQWEKIGNTDDALQNSDTEKWYSLGIDWSTDEHLGLWKLVSTIDVLEDDCEIEDDCLITGKCSFFNRVTAPVPEPISSTLFLLGAGAFGLRLRRRKA